MMDARYVGGGLQTLAVQKLRKLLLAPSASPQSRERILAVLKRIDENAERNHRQRAAANDNAKVRTKAKPHSRHP